MKDEKITAREKAVELIGERNVIALEASGVNLSWQCEYDMKEFVLRAENEDDIIQKLESLSVQGVAKHA